MAEEGSEFLSSLPIRTRTQALVSICLVAASQTSFELTSGAFNSVYFVTFAIVLADHHSPRYWLLQFFIT